MSLDQLLLSPSDYVKLSVCLVFAASGYPALFPFILGNSLYPGCLHLNFSSISTVVIDFHNEKEGHEYL